MHDPGIVSCLQRLGELPDNADGPIDGQGAVTIQELEQRLAFHVPHRQESQALALANVVETDDVAVRDLTRQHYLAAEAFDPLRFLAEVGPQQFQRDLYAERLVARAIDHAHPPDASEHDDAVAASDERARSEPPLCVDLRDGVGERGRAASCPALRRRFGGRHRLGMVRHRHRHTVIPSRLPGQWRS